MDLQLANRIAASKSPESLIEVILHLTQWTVSAMRMLVNLAKADPVGAQLLGTLLASAVSKEFGGARDRVGDNRSGFENWSGKEMLVVAAAL
jgi:hypothetical protein